MLNNLLEKQQNEGWKVYIRHEGIDKNLSGVFWVTDHQQKDFLQYNDIILNDNTSKTNRFNMMMSVFVIIDSTTRSRMVAQALLNDETLESYVWMLECFLKAFD